MTSAHLGPSMQDWETPWHIVRALEEEMGRSFDLDVCANASNAKAAIWIDEMRDGLSAEWGWMNWCNPPYANQADWLHRAWEWASIGRTTCCLVKASVDAQYWWKLVANRARCDLYVGRIAFLHPSTKQPQRGSNFASALVIYGPGFGPGVQRWRSAKTGRLLDGSRPDAGVDAGT